MKATQLALILTFKLAILQIQWKPQNGPDLAITYCKKAIEIDPLCDIGYTQLAQLLCVQNSIDEAIEIYEKAIAIARTEPEIMNVVSCQEAAMAQKYVVDHFPDVMESLKQVCFTFIIGMTTN